MRFSLMFFAAGGTGHQDHYRLLLEAARRVDDSPVTAVWLPERHFTEFGGPYPNPAVLAAGVAVATSRLGLRAGSVIAPLHDPLRIAEEWSVVDQLSGGRVELSFGSGWNVNDFVLAPGDYEARRELTWERIETVRRLWRGERLPRRNGAGNTVAIGSLPHPVQAELPVWLTAQSSSTFARAGAAGLPVLTNLNFNSPTVLETNAKTYWEEARAAANRDRAAIALMVHTFVGADDSAARRAVADPLRGYLRANLDMRARFAEGKTSDPPAATAVGEEQVRDIIERGVGRITDWAGLIGGPGTVADRAASFGELGVQELACLIDFGVPPDEALASVSRLCDLAERLS
jgi:natural product biosynthesis luciferase-like monooxygenase protein